MKFVILAIGLTSSMNILAATNYSYCQREFNNNFKNIKTANSPFKLQDNGKIVINPDVIYKVDGKSEVFESKNENRVHQTTIKRNDRGEIIMVVDFIKDNNFLPVTGYYINKKTTPDSYSNESTYKVEIKNGKCIPTQLNVVAEIGDESRQDVMYDLFLCRDLKLFFNKYPEAISSIDKDLINQIQNIFSRYYLRNPDIYGTENSKETIGWSKPIPLKSNLTPVLSDINRGVSLAGGGMSSKSKFLQPLVPTVDSAISKITSWRHNSPIIAAGTISLTCGGGYISNLINNMVDDDSLWKK